VDKPLRKSSFDLQGLLACARGELFGPGNPQLPLPPMLMFDRITSITEDGGTAGFFLGWMGGLGRGRALGVDEVKFTGMVLPTAKKITYIVNFRRVIMRKLVLGIADGTMKVDGKVVYEAKGLKVGLYTDAAMALAQGSAAPASA